MSVLDEQTANALRDAGYDPDRYTFSSVSPAATDAPPAGTPEPAESNVSDWGSVNSIAGFRVGAREAEPEPETVDDISFTADDQRRLGYNRKQIDYAVRQQGSPAEQINLYARLDDVRRMAEVAEGSNILSDDELEETARDLNVPPNLAAMLNQDYPDQLAQRKMYAKMLRAAKPDSYFAQRFGSDPKYAAVMRGHEMAFADLQAAVTNAYTSNAGIMWGWLKNAAASTWAETSRGIAAGLSQQARDIRDTYGPAIQEELPIPEGLRESDPAQFLELEAHNLRIRENNELVRSTQTPEAQAEAEANREWANNLDDWLQDAYLDTKASAYAGRTETGNWWLDTVARAPIEGAPSLAMALVETFFSGGTLPLVHFGLQAQTSSYRDMRAENVDPATALAVSTARGLFEGYVEKLSVENIFRGSGIKELFRGVTGPSTTLSSRIARVGGHALKSGLGEGVEEVLQGAGEAAATPLAKAISLGDPYSNVFSEVYEKGGDLAIQGWGGIFLGFLGGGFLGNTRRELSDMRQYNAFQKSAGQLVAAGDAALKSGKGLAETRGEVRNMSHAAIAKGDTSMGTTVYADIDDAERYLQGKPRDGAERTLAKVGVTPEMFEQAKADHTDIEIPIENYAVQEGGSDPELVRLFRPTPNMATAAAISQRTQEAAGIFEQARELRKIIDADTEGKQVPAAIQTLRQDLKTGLNWRAQEADFAASMAWSYAKAQAERRGVDINQFLADSLIGNIRANMDAWIQRNPAWLAGVRAPVATAETEETANDAEIDASPTFDPALGEGTLDVPEQPGDGGAVLPGPESAAASQPVDTGSGGAGGQIVEPPATVPATTLFSPPPRVAQPGEYADRLTGLPFAMETVSTEGIKTDPGALQFKRDADAETGVKKGQEIPGDVNPAALGTMVLYEDVDGGRFVVSGHHRLDLLRRKGEEAEVRAVILRENDGWTTDQARVYGAALNIQEGGGDTDDYATFFRETRNSLDRDRAESEGLLRRDNARTGYAIGALGSDNVFYGFLNGELSARQAAAIANAAPGDPAIQDLMIARKIPPAEMETFAGYVRKMQNSGALNLDGVQLSLFAGKDHSAMLAAMEKESKAASKEAADLDKKAASLESLLKAGKTLSTAELRKHGARAGDREGLRLEAEALRAEAGRWRKFFQHPDILAQVQERAGTAVKPETFYQPAYHGSPYRFDEFSLGAIGTGEGNQSYGWGLYFAGNRNVSEAYRESLSSTEYYEGDRKLFGDEAWAAQFLHDVNNKRMPMDYAIKKVSETVQAKTPEQIERYTNIMNFVVELSNKDISVREGQLYKVDIPESDVLLDWDKPLSEQPNKIKSALKEIKQWLDSIGYGETALDTYVDGYNADFEEWTGRMLYRALDRESDAIEGISQAGEDAGGQRAASEFLLKHGISGLRYLDGNSRAAGEGTHNYVIFDDNAINILETYYQKVSGETRGEVELYRSDATHRQAAVIRVMRNGDMSTILHELAHIFLADMRDYVTAGSADIDTVRDYGKLLQAAGDLSQGKANQDNVEQVARWFEEYLREGRAPSVELVKPFGLFSKWLTNVYGNIREYVGREMDRETRGVFDRWLASERDIAEAEAYYGGLKSAKFLNLIDDEEKRRKLAEQLDRTRQRIVSRHAGEMAKAWTRANADRGTLEGEARREVEEAPVYRAVREARRSRIDHATAEATVGVETVARIVGNHGDIFAKSGNAEPVDVKATLRRAGYHEADPFPLFLKELSAAVPVAEAVRKEGSQARRKRFYEALDAVAQAGGIDPDILPDVDPETIAGLEKHPGLFRADGRENLDRIAMATGFKTPSAMLDAMAKAPSSAGMVESLTERKVRAKAKESRIWAEDSLAEVMDDTPPAGQAALHDPDEDAAADGIEIQRDALRQAIEARTNRRRKYVSRRAMEDAARETLFSQPLRDAMNYNNHAKAERHWSNVAAEAMAMGGIEEALDALDKQQKFHALTGAAFRIRRDYTDFLRRYGVRMARSELATVESAYRDAARDILTFTGVVVDRSGRFAPENSDPDRLILPQAMRDEFDVNRDGDPDASVQPFHPDMETLIPEWIRLKKLPRNYTGNILDLTPAHMADIDASIKNLVKYGREELTALRDKDNQTIADLRDKLMATMATLPDKRKLLTEDRKFDRLRAGLDDYLAGNLSIDALAEQIDGYALHTGREMGLMVHMIGKIRGGEVEQAELLTAFQDNTTEDFRVLDAFIDRLKKENGTFFNPQGVPSPADLTGGRSANTEWVPEMILSVMFNAGNRGNLYALQQGYNLTDAELYTLFALATEQEWLAVQHVAKEMESLFPLMDAVHYNLTNRHLVRVQPERLQIDTADGKTLDLDGWYYPLVADPKLNDNAARRDEAADYRAVMSAIFNPQTLRDGFTRSRIVDEDGMPVNTQPPLLRPRVIAQHMATATRWIALAEPLMEFRRVTMDPAFREAFIQKLGAERYRDLRMWTNRMARPDKGLDEGMNRYIRRLKNASTVSALGFNLRSATRQLSSAGLAADAMSKAGHGKAAGWWYMWSGLRTMGARGSLSRLLSPLSRLGINLRSEATDEMFRLSPEAKHRSGNVNKEIRDALDRFSPLSGRVARNWAKVKEALFHFTISVDHIVSGAAFWGAYEQASTGNAGFDIKGLTQEEIEAKAVEYANYIVRTQQSPYQADYTRLQANNGAVSLMTQFMGGLTPYLNNTYINVQLARQAGWKGKISLGTHLLNAYVIPSVALTMLMREAWRGLTGADDEEEDNELAWDIAEEIVGQATGGLVGVRDVARWGVRSARKGQPAPFSVMPTTAFPERILKRSYNAAEKLLVDGDAYAAGKDAGMAAAEILGVSAPIRQLEPLAVEYGLVDEE